MAPTRTILHPTDFSAHSELAFELALSLAKQQRARLVVLHVAVPPVVMYDEKGSLLPPPRDCREVARERLAALRPADPTVPLQCLVGEGEVPARILRAASELGADLIVMGSLGRTGLDRLLVGSVAAEVMRCARCPVVTIRAPRPGQETPITRRGAAEGVNEGQRPPGP